MKKYFMTMAVLAIFAIGFTASDDTDSSSSEKVTTTVQEPKKNPIEKFVGTYVLYDDWCTGGDAFVTEDGRLFYKNDDGTNVKCGDIRVISDNAFECILGRDFMATYGKVDEVYSYRNGKVVTQKHGINFMTAIVFDLSEKKLYVGGYKNRDYESPEYYKFRFTKK